MTGRLEAKFAPAFSRDLKKKIGNPTLALLSEIAGALGQELTVSVP